MNNKILVLAILAVGLLAGPMVAQAVPTAGAAQVVPATWIDTLLLDEPVWIGPDYSYTHDLTDGEGGFRPLTDLIFTYELWIDLFDDKDLLPRIPELGLVNLPGLIGDRVFFDLTGTEGGGWSLEGWILLNLTGQLDVTITSLIGDFNFGGSRLAAHGVRSVPEPGTLALLGLGLAGLGVSKRRKKT